MLHARIKNRVTTKFSPQGEESERDGRNKAGNINQAGAARAPKDIVVSCHLNDSFGLTGYGGMEGHIHGTHTLTDWYWTPVIFQSRTLHSRISRGVLTSICPPGIQSHKLSHSSMSVHTAKPLSSPRMVKRKSVES